LSNHQAIAAVTATLRSLLNSRFIAEGMVVNVTARPPDKAAGNNVSTQLNLFLYRTSMSAALRNSPQKVKPGETGPPPLSLKLYYLITAYGPDDENEDLIGHQLLGKAMSVLHDHPLLGAPEIKDATSSIKASDLHNQIERIRITPEPMTLEDMSKLWATFQTNFRISAAYEVAVVLIDSTRPVKTPLPVLARGAEDEGATAEGSLASPFPTLEALETPGLQLSAQLGDALTLKGFNLEGSNLKVLVVPPQSTAEKELTIEGQSTNERIQARIPNDPADFPAGYYKLRVSVRRGAEAFDRSTNTLSFSVAPKIAAPALPHTAAIVDGDVTLSVTPEPQVLVEQRASLLLGEREILAEVRGAKTDPLVFVVKDAPTGTYLVRLRVDGVDSLLVDTTKQPPVFDQTQTVKITT
jgi:hypothetical protein